jgi:23S rRNA pseudouridine2605 synthase
MSGMAERLQKYLARAGVASRRHAEELISEGRVAVNNVTVRELGTKVEPGRDLVTVDGKLVEPAEERAYFILYKPPGVVTTMEDPQGRPTVAEYVKGVRRRLFPVGRLDFDAEGALLFTDDGELAHALTHPSYEVRRTYLAKVKGTPTPEALARLREGVRLEDGPAKALEAEVFEAADRNTWIRITVGEGRQHLVKRLCAAIGHPLLRLYRPVHGGVGVEGLEPGAIRPLSSDEVERVKAVAGGATPPPATFSLPPRRHGRSAPGFARDDEDAIGEGSRERQPTSERFGAPRRQRERPGEPTERGDRAYAPRRERDLERSTRQPERAHGERRGREFGSERGDRVGAGRGRGRPGEQRAREFGSERSDRRTGGDRGRGGAGERWGGAQRGDRVGAERGRERPGEPRGREFGSERSDRRTGGDRGRGGVGERWGGAERGDRVGAGRGRERPGEPRGREFGGDRGDRGRGGPGERRDREFGTTRRDPGAGGERSGGRSGEWRGRQLRNERVDRGASGERGGGRGGPGERRDREFGTTRRDPGAGGERSGGRSGEWPGRQLRNERVDRSVGGDRGGGRPSERRGRAFGVGQGGRGVRKGRFGALPKRGGRPGGRRDGRGPDRNR